MTGSVGLLLVITEVYKDIWNIYFDTKGDAGFALEELLLGFSGICMLLEEYRLLRSDSEARNEADKLLDDVRKVSEKVDSKQQDVDRMKQDVDRMREDVDRMHRETTDRISKVGPRIIQAVKNIFKSENEQE